MGMSRIFGVVLLVLGVALLAFGYNASQSVGERVVEGLTGRFTNETMWFLIGGIVALVGGAALALRSGRQGT